MSAGCIHFDCVIAMILLRRLFCIFITVSFILIGLVVVISVGCSIVGGSAERFS